MLGDEGLKCDRGIGTGALLQGNTQLLQMGKKESGSGDVSENAQTYRKMNKVA